MAILRHKQHGLMHQLLCVELLLAAQLCRIFFSIIRRINLGQLPVLRDFL